MLRIAWLLAALAAAWPASAARPDIALGRYEARTLVTGTDMRSRPAGLALCLMDVLVKVSGDPTLAGDARAAALGARATDFVVDLDYVDRMSGLAHHDEQGSSDRPFFLTVRFDTRLVDAALAALGRAPWPDPRPVLVPVVDVQPTTGPFQVTREEPRADGMRAAIAEAGQRYGMEVAIPGAADPQPNDLPAGRVALRGSLVLSEAAHGWVGAWHVDWQGTGYDWGIAGVNFDEAYRQAVRGAMQVVSGHGAPD